MNSESENLDLIPTENEETVTTIKDEEKVCPECGELISKSDKHEICKVCRKKAKKAKRKEWWDKYGPAVAFLGIFAGSIAIGAIKSRILSDDCSIVTDDDFEDGSYLPHDDLDAEIDIATDDDSEGSGYSIETTIYTTSEWSGYGKQNFYCHEYRRAGNEIPMYKCHRYKFFDGDENTWEEEERLVDFWDKDDPNMPAWLKNYID